MKHIVNMSFTTIESTGLHETGRCAPVIAYQLRAPIGRHLPAVLTAGAHQCQVTCRVLCKMFLLWPVAMSASTGAEQAATVAV